MNDPQGFRKRVLAQQESSTNYMSNGQVPQLRCDPINFTNQYNIYNPVIGSPAASLVNPVSLNPQLMWQYQ